MIRTGFLAFLIFFVNHLLPAQTLEQPWHGIGRSIHYKPDGKDFLLVSGKNRFNRALYGTNTGFRVETGDLPEFALYMPGMGGNLKFGLISGDTSKWIIDSKNIQTRYRPGSMLYDIRDPMLGNGVLHLEVLALASGEGMIIKAEFSGIKNKLDLFWTFGGATGKKFSRDGDIGADPESVFYLHPQYCRDNIYTLNKNSFHLLYGSGKVLSEEERYEIQHSPGKAKEAGNSQKQKHLEGTFPVNAKLQLANAEKQDSPLSLLASKAGSLPVLTGFLPAKSGKALYFLIRNPDKETALTYTKLPQIFAEAEKTRKELAGRVQLNTPDPYINTLGGTLAVAADAIWESPSYLHGAVAWRMRLNAWRGAYVADPLGWHDRAKLHFSSYAKSQVISPLSGPVVADTALHLARQLEKIGTAMFSSGYISRNPNNNTKAHHYDMNLVFIDQLLNHFYWTGDLSFAREMWPVLQRHLAWEKRNFDADGDGLYDAYADIWASDAIQYSGGGVIYSSAYNYKANQLAARLAGLIGENPSPYQQEAEKILKAVNSVLWLQDKGHYAEYKDLLGLKLLHPAAGLWSVYHTIDSKVPDPFQAYQLTRYVDTRIPHIPVMANGLKDEGYHTLATTNWQPYTWSVNNVVLAEVLHTSLAYWQAGRQEEAFKLWKSSLIESMYLGKSPGNFQQLSFYDTMRGELYRDFADPIGMAGRSLVEGLFGIQPDELSGTLTIRPGLPTAWNFASLKVPDISFDYKRNGSRDTYTIIPAFAKPMNLRLEIPARAVSIKSISINGNPVKWNINEESVGTPLLQISSPQESQYQIEIEWQGEVPEKAVNQIAYTGSDFTISFKDARVLQLTDPQQLLNKPVISNNKITARILSSAGDKTLFVKLRQGDFTWWEPVNLKIKSPVEIITPAEQQTGDLIFSLVNHSNTKQGRLTVNTGAKAFSQDIRLSPDDSLAIKVPDKYLHPGTNRVRFQYDNGETVEKNIQNWSVKPAEKPEWQMVDLSSAFNAKVTDIFKNKYLSPRPQSPTLQLPWQGIGNWCYPLAMANIDDSGLRKLAGNNNEIQLPAGIPLTTPADSSRKNIIFTSQWNNYPDSVSLPLSGKATHAYLMMAGSTNPMQSRMDNAEIIVYYKDNTSECLSLRNPENWWPIEQDYYTDGYAFTTDAPKPYRVYLKTGEITRNFNHYTAIKGFTNYAVDGGAATILDLPLNPAKELKELKLKTLTNDVVVGLMSVTLQKERD